MGAGLGLQEVGHEGVPAKASGPAVSMRTAPWMPMPLSRLAMICTGSTQLVEQHGQLSKNLPCITSAILQPASSSVSCSDAHYTGRRTQALPARSCVECRLHTIQGHNSISTRANSMPHRADVAHLHASWHAIVEGAPTRAMHGPSVRGPPHR